MTENSKSDSGTTQLPISLRLSNDILAKVDKIAEDIGSSRSGVLVKAVTHYVTSPRCINCGAINPSGGSKCAVCGTPLYTDDEIAWALLSLGMVGKIGVDLIMPINSLLDVAKRYYQRLKAIDVIIESTFSIDKSKTPTEYRIKLIVTFERGSYKVPNDSVIDHIFLNEGVIVPQNVLIDRLNFNRANSLNLEYKSLLDYIKETESQE